MKDEYIRRQAEIEALENKAHLEWGYLRVAMPLLKTLETIPAADVAPVAHSRWIKTADGAECEICGREAVYQIVDDHWEYEPFCPHCGSIMDNKRGNENG